VAVHEGFTYVMGQRDEIRGTTRVTCKDIKRDSDIEAQRDGNDVKERVLMIS
jgi:hypothetical protein